MFGYCFLGYSGMMKFMFDCIMDYKVLIVEEVSDVKKVVKCLLIVNYLGEGFWEMIKVEWVKLFVDYKGVWGVVEIEIYGVYCFCWCMMYGCMFVNVYIIDMKIVEILKK